MELRLGDVLIQRGVLDREQVDRLMEIQAETGEPLGLLAERVFDVDPLAVEAAWAQQYACLTRTIEPGAETFCSEALELINRRQAWQFRVLPIRFDPTELMVATTQMHLPRALRFAANVIGCPLYFVMCAPDELGAALCTHYPLAGLTPGSVADDGLDRILASARGPAPVGS